MENKEKNSLNNYRKDEQAQNSNISNSPEHSKDKPFFIRSDDVVHLQTPIKDRFRVLLKRIGRSQNWLAFEVGISTGTMSRIANGDWFPQSEVMTRICEILEVQSHALFGDSKHWKQWNDKIVYPKEEREK